MDTAYLLLAEHTAYGACRDRNGHHPSTDGAAIGETSFADFRLLTTIVGNLADGGVVLNLELVVLLREVFLKALTFAGNLGNHVKQFTTANVDMIQQYGLLENDVRRLTSTDGQGYNFTGHHEIMIPLFAHAICGRLEEDAD